MKSLVSIALLALFLAGCDATGLGTDAGGTGPTTSDPNANFSVQALTPPDGREGVSTTTSIFVTFSSRIDDTSLSSSNISVMDEDGITYAGAISWSYQTKTLVLTPTHPFPEATRFFLAIANLKDESGNSINFTLQSSFVTAEDSGDASAADTTAPTVTGTGPLNNATGVAIDSNIEVTFSEELAPTTAISSNVQLTQGSTVVAATPTYSSNKVTLNPDLPLGYGTLYTVTVTTGIKDTSGNPLASAFSSSFTTVLTPDTTAPALVSTSPASGDTGVAIGGNITLTFSEPITLNSAASLKQGSTPVTSTITVNGPVLTINPDSDLSYGTVYTVDVSTALTDTATTPNSLAPAISYTFTTATAPDTTAPAGPPTVSINDAAASTDSRSVTVDTTATDAFGVTGYYLVEASSAPSTPSASAADWVAVSSATSYSGSNIAVTMSTSGTGTKTVYAFFKDSAGNVSDVVSDTIALNPTQLVWEYEAPTSQATNVYGIDANNSGYLYIAGAAGGNDHSLGFALDNLSPAPLSIQYQAYDLTGIGIQVVDTGFNEVAMDNNDPPNAYLVGVSLQSGDNEFTVARMTSAGALDTTFDDDATDDGVDFYSHIDASDFYDVARGVDVNDRDGDGAIDEIIVVGSMQVDGTNQTDCGVVEFNTSGTDQWATIIAGNDVTINGASGTADDAWENCYDVVVNSGHADKYSVTFGFLQIDYNATGNGRFGDSFLLALNGSGAQQNDFGNNSFEAGTFIYDVGNAQSRSDLAMTGAFDSNGKLVVAGFVEDTNRAGDGSIPAGADWDLYVLRTTANAGGLDTTFDSDGIFITDLGDIGTTYSAPLKPSVAIDSSNNVYVGATKHNGTTLDGVVYAYDNTGALMWTITYDSGNSNTAGDYLEDVKIINDGTDEYLIVAVDLAHGSGSNRHIYLAKYRLN